MNIMEFCKYRCRYCSLVYDEELGDPIHGIEPQTRWSEMSDDWSCPHCGAEKADFELIAG